MKKSLILLTAAVVPLSAALAPSAAGAASRDSGPRAATTCTAEHVSAPPGTRIESVTAVARPAGTLSFTFPVPQTVTDVPARCEVTVTLTHPGANDHVTFRIALPQDAAKWNGRFQGTGGSAYLAGDFGAPLATAVKDGYVGAATDAGVGQSPTDVSGWALTAAGTVNKPLLKNFAARSVHELAVVGKDVAHKFYGKPVRYSYWNGCSTGGRQGYLAAQDYPTDFQGILAKAPAINWDRFAVATLWSQAVFAEENVQPSQCELEAFNTAAIKACDTLDGVRNGIIDDPGKCHWDARRLIGTKVLCEGQELTISAATANAVRKIWAGPVTPGGRQLWYGPNKGASFSSLAKVDSPFVVADQWVKYFVQKDPSFDSTSLTYREFAKIFRQSQQQYNRVIGTDDPDLSAFARAGGKLLSWHGQTDQLVPTRGTIDYRERVNHRYGGNQRVDNFYRLFLLPGVNHCGGGVGPQPTGELDALVNWVEQHRSPATLATSSANGSVTRNICRYPQVAHYVGHGDPADAANYRCASA